jgi:hypothetical protein
MNPPNHGAPLRALSICAMLFLSPTLQAQERCSVEVKLLLLPKDTRAAIAALNFKSERAGRVYFFDTPTLDLLSQGVILRLRQGSANDLTVKLRPRAGKRFSDPSLGREDFKCEVDQNASQQNTSYSMRSKYAWPPLPETGNDILRLLSVGQRKLLEEAQVSIDWRRVKRIADIKTTDWQTEARPQFKKLTMELWESPACSILELSTRVGPDAGPATYTELKRLANSKKLPLNARQQPKTTIVLEALTHATEHY